MHYVHDKLQLNLDLEWGGGYCVVTLTVVFKLSSPNEMHCLEITCTKRVCIDKK